MKIRQLFNGRKSSNFKPEKRVEINPRHWTNNEYSKYYNLENWKRNNHWCIEQQTLKTSSSLKSYHPAQSHVSPGCLCGGHPQHPWPLTTGISEVASTRYKEERKEKYHNPPSAKESKNIETMPEDTNYSSAVRIRRNSQRNEKLGLEQDH